MENNIGNMDKGIRVGVALVIAGLYFINVITGTLAVVLLVCAGVLVLTSLVSFCPLYSLLGISTCPVEPVEPAGSVESTEENM